MAPDIVVETDSIVAADPINTLVVKENAGPQSLRLRVMGTTTTCSLNNAFKVYPNRPLFGTRVTNVDGSLGPYKVSLRCLSLLLIANP